MIRLFNALALIALIASATWAYSVKYETILVAEKLRKREAELQRERDAVTILQAEWHLLNRPQRMQSLAKPEAGMQMISARQVARAADIPHAAPDKGDKIDALLTGSIPTPDSARKNTGKAAGATPATTPKLAVANPRSATPAATTGAARGGTRTDTTRSAGVKAKSTAPLGLIPPAKIGPAPAKSTPRAAPVAAVAVSPPTPEPKSTNPLTGFLKQLIR